MAQRGTNYARASLFNFQTSLLVYSCVREATFPRGVRSKFAYVSDKRVVKRDAWFLLRLVHSFLCFLSESAPCASRNPRRGAEGLRIRY